LTYSKKGWVYDPWGPIEAFISENNLFLSGYYIPFWDLDTKISLFYQGETYTLFQNYHLFSNNYKSLNESSLKAPLTGKVALVFVQEGDIVKENQPLLVLEAMKMEHLITSPKNGIVKRIFYNKGDVVEEGKDVININEEERHPHDITKPR
jgi:acetyl/propionyl-CoA carboxylase alpha subunit